MMLNKAKYRITDVVWYLHKGSNGEFALRSSAVTGWNASNTNSEEIVYRYTLADGSNKLETEIYREPLIAISRLLDPLKKKRWFADMRELLPSPDVDGIARAYLMDSERYYYLREDYSGIDFQTTLVITNLSIIRNIDFRKHFEQCRFAGCIGNFDIVGMTFINCDFSNSYFPSSVIRRTVFDGTSFENAEFGESNLHDNSFVGCNMELAKLHGAEFKRCKLIRTTFRSANAVGADFSRADARNSIFDDASLEGVCFNQANLSGASIKESGMFNASFQRAIMTGCDLSESFIKNCDFREAIGITNEQLYAFANKDIDTYTFTGVDGEIITVP